jgi:16S rRNA A1518/A1519 N6-dimethyltransferase RsmA/KsgA/DIM1 with predicted DNA glycosylase/AP lyase activity
MVEEQLEQAPEALNISAQERAEKLSLEQFLALTCDVQGNQS